MLTLTIPQQRAIRGSAVEVPVRVTRLPELLARYTIEITQIGAGDGGWPEINFRSASVPPWPRAARIPIPRPHSQI